MREYPGEFLTYELGVLHSFGDNEDDSLIDEEEEDDSYEAIGNTGEVGAVEQESINATSAISLEFSDLELSSSSSTEEDSYDINKKWSFAQWLKGRPIRSKS